MVKYSYDHIHLYSANPAEAASFYETMFGAARTATRPDGRVDLRVGGQMLLISSKKEHASQHTPQSAGLDHFGYVVDDIQEAVRELTAKGAKILKEATTVRPGVHIAFVEGPDAVRIELVQRE